MAVRLAADRRRVVVAHRLQHSGMQGATFMLDTREIRYFDYVNGGYEQVRDALQANALGVCHAATKTTAAPGAASAATLHVGARGFEIGTDVDITFTKVEERPATHRSPESTTFTFEWQAAAYSWLFPHMRAELAVYPVSATYTQLELVGRYDPPLGPVGAAVDALIGRRVADACVDRFLSDVAGHLRATLPHDARPQ
jgi:hypothetical protein